MKRNIALLAIAGLLFLSSCMPMSMTELNINQTNKKKLSHLSLSIDETSLYTAYVTGMKQQRIQDTKALIERELYSNISEETGTPVGYIKYEIPTSKIKNNNLLMWPAIFCYCIPLVAGIPLTYYNVDLELQVSIYGNNNALIKKYTAYGNGKEKSQMYKYNGQDASRLANIYAVKEALNQIDQKILADYDEIETKLKN